MEKQLLKRWEVILPDSQFDAFHDMLADVDNVWNGIVRNNHGNDRAWVTCWPSEEFKVIAKLKFEILEVPAYGTEVDFSD